MNIIGCDFHTRLQQIAMVDTRTGEVVEKTLEHGRVAQKLMFNICDQRS